jgi:cobalamin biosynthesis Mg chelatase CobN
MFEDVDKNNQPQDQKQGSDSSPASAEIQAQKKEAEKTAGRSKAEAAKENDQGSTGDTGIPGGQVEDIFAGLDQGTPPGQEMAGGDMNDLSEPSSSVFNKGTAIFVVIVFILSIVILGGSWWVSEWLTSSLGA